MANGAETSAEPPAVAWSGLEILAVLFAATLWPLLLYELFRRAGWYSWFYGSEFLAGIDKAGADDPQLTRVRLGLWAVCSALPLQVGSALLILRAFSGARPADAGLTSRRLGRNVLAGLLAAAVLVPGVYGVQGLLVWLIQFLDLPSQEHSLTKLGQLSLYPVEWVLLVVSAVVIAPFWEELFFRGIVQPWVMSRPYGGPAALLAALTVALSSRMESLQAALRSRQNLLFELSPFVVLLALVPVYRLLERRSKPAAGLFASAVLFAWVHAAVWPSPIPLLWLALGLGWLAMRTRSLVGPMVLHSLFNGVACVLLVLTTLFKVGS
jgi:membrane protease YdiL (CAAX protease family)